MTADKPLFARLQHRHESVRAAARAEVAVAVASHGGDDRAAARELGLSLRTLRRALAAAAPGKPAATPRAEAAADPRDPRPDRPLAAIGAPRRAPRLLLGATSGPAEPHPFTDFDSLHRLPLGAQGSPAPPGGLRLEHWAAGMPAGGPRANPAARGGIEGAVTATARQPREPPSPSPTAVAAVAGEWPRHQPDAAALPGKGHARTPGLRRLAFVLHAHLPWVLGHGRWPHGEDWLAEAVAHCYLPLLGALQRLAARGGRDLMTLSVSPVLAAQLADPRIGPLVSGYLDHRRDNARALAARHPLGSWWEETYLQLAADWAAVGGDLLSPLAALRRDGVIELSTCAVTHGYLPLLHRQAHVSLQLAAARHNHERWFGEAPLGLWMPECAYRPTGPWHHPATGASEPLRPGNEVFLAAAGVRWTVVDAHLLVGGQPLVPYPELWAGGVAGTAGDGPPLGARLQPRWVGQSAVAVLAREPHTAHQVWSRHGGYPGDPRYLDFHKRDADSGLRLWRVTDAAGELGDKLPYHPAEALAAAREHAAHFHQLVAGIPGLGGGVAACPYDAELFGHWWYEGVAWLEELLGHTLGIAGEREARQLATTTPARELGEHAPAQRARLLEGSWGESGDHRMWVNEKTAWMWEDLRRAEEAVDGALGGLSRGRARAALAQLLLLAASDWPFLVSNGTAEDYAAARFRLHRDRLHELLGGISPELPRWAAEDLAGVEIDPAWWREAGA